MLSKNFLLDIVSTIIRGMSSNHNNFAASSPALYSMKNAKKCL